MCAPPGPLVGSIGAISGRLGSLGPSWSALLGNLGASSIMWRGSWAILVASWAPSGAILRPLDRNKTPTLATLAETSFHMLRELLYMEIPCKQISTCSQETLYFEFLCKLSLAPSQARAFPRKISSLHGQGRV